MCYRKLNVNKTLWNTGTIAITTFCKNILRSTSPQKHEQTESGGLQMVKEKCR